MICCDHCGKVLDCSSDSDDFPNESDDVLMTSFDFDLCRECYDLLAKQLKQHVSEFLNCYRLNKKEK